MKTKQGIFFWILGLSGLLSNGQTIATTVLTSGGLQAGTVAPLVGGNTFYGYQAGNVNSSSAGYNTFLGSQSGLYNTTGKANTYIGWRSGGDSNTSGSDNIALGLSAGRSNGDSNIFIGNYSGAEDSVTTGNGNIYIGHNAGFADISGGNKLIIDNGFFPFETTTPLIYGDFANDLLKFHGKVGIGGGGATDTPFGNFPTTAGSIDVSNYRLFVKGGMLTEEVRVSLKSSWADYVFKKDYKLPTLQEVEKQIQDKGHLFNLPSAQQVKEDGIELGEMAKIQQEKIEELTLYLIQQNKEIEVLKTQVKALLNSRK
jgi:hypothetical protein